MTYKIMIVDDQFVSRELFKLYIEQSPDYEGSTASIRRCLLILTF